MNEIIKVILTPLPIPDLLCCDYCSKAYHLECHLPPLVKIPTGLWKCQECAAVEYIRKMKCGECKACRADDCGKCEFCLDKPKFGGTNRLKQVCVKRKCPYMRFAPPAKVTPKELSKEEYRELKLQFAKGPPRPSKKRAREDTSGKDSREADYTPLQDDVSNKERGRPEKRQKTAIFSDTIEEPTDEASAKQQDPDEASAKQQDPKSDEKPVDEVSPTTVLQPNNIPVERKIEPDDNMLALISFIKSIPLNDDHIGKKIRQIIVNALQNPDNAKTQDLACEALRNLANDPDDVSKIIRLGGLKMVAKAMKDHPDKTIVQAEASALLSQLAWVDPACSAAIITEGLHHLVLSSMRRHVNHLKVQQMGCGFFRSLSYDFANHECIENVNGVVEIIDAMKRNAKKKLVMIEGCYFLQNILCNPDILPETIRLVVSSEVAFTVVDGLSENIDDADYVDAACGVISNLAINEDARSNIGRYTPSIRSLLTILGPDTSEDAWKSSMNALKLLATGNVDTKAKIVCHGGIKKVIDILQTCQDADISHLGLQLLAELCRDDEDIANRLAESGCLNLVTNQMRKQPDLPFIQATCCGILRNIPIGNSDQAKCTTELILAAMEKHGEDKLVQFEGCHVLLRHCCRFASISEYLQSKVLCKAKANARPMRRQVRKQTCSKQPTGNSEPSYATTMTKQHHENEQESKYDDLDIDFIKSIKPLTDDHVGKKIRQIIVKALKNPDNSKTQDLACEALRKSTNVPDDVSKIIHHGGLKMVAKAMKDHPDKTIVQAEASALLAQLAWVDPVCVAAIIAEGLHHLVLSSMRRHVNHLKVQQMGCGFFRSLSYDFANHECIENVNGVVEIIDAMKRNAKKKLVMIEGCYFLQNILCNPDILPETIRLVVSSEVAFTVVDGLSENIDDADYVDAACGVISNLAINEDARSHVGDYQKSVPLLLTILGPDTSEDAWKSSMNALKLLATGNVDTKAKIVDHGGIKKVIDYMKQQNNDVVVVDTGLGLLSELASDNRKISRLLFNSGCFDLIKEATAKHSESPHIQARACELLSNLPIDANDVKGAIGFTLTAMTNHKLSFVQYAGCHALLQFCCRFPESAQLLQSKRASPILRQSQYTPWNDMINLNEFHE